MDEEEKRLLDYYGRLSRYTQRIALAQIVHAAETEENARKIAAAEVEEAARKIAQGLTRSGPEYADRRPAPVGAALAGEALHG